MGHNTFEKVELELELHNIIIAAAGNWELETQHPFVAFSSFSPVTVCEISSLILSCESKSSLLTHYLRLF